VKVPDMYLDRPRYTFFSVEAGAFAIVYTFRGAVLAAWFYPRPTQETGDSDEDL
jgi:hypothetical protein